MAAFPKLASPVTPAEVFVAPATLDSARAAEAVANAVRGGVLRPSDIATSDIEPAALLYVPFFRVDVAVDGFHIGLGSMTGQNGRTIPIPTGGARHKDAVVTICARTIVPYVAKPPSFLSRAAGAPALEVGPEELVPLAQAESALADAEVVDADLTKDHAEKMATGMLLRAVNPSNAIYSSYQPQIRSTTFCLYPVYYARYGYEGEARRHAGEQFFVAISGRTGAVVSDKHPSAARAMAAKVRRLLSFDRR